MTSIFLMGTMCLFAVLMFIGCWLTFFSFGPAAWIEGTYFTSTFLINNSTMANSTTSSSSESTGSLIQGNLRPILIGVGLICLLVSYILFISMQLVKKVMRRLEQVNLPV